MMCKIRYRLCLHRYSQEGIYRGTREQYPRLNRIRWTLESLINIKYYQLRNRPRLWNQRSLHSIKIILPWSVIQRCKLVEFKSFLNRYYKLRVAGHPVDQVRIEVVCKIKVLCNSKSLRNPSWSLGQHPNLPQIWPLKESLLHLQV